MSQNKDRDLIELQKKVLDNLLLGKLPASVTTEPKRVNPWQLSGAQTQKNLSPAEKIINSKAGVDIREITDDEYLIDYFDKFNTLVLQIGEIRRFMQDLCQGDLDAPPPGRRNYLAAPLKELHTQLSSLRWSMEQLAKGNVVSRLFYKGALFESFNSLIEKVASTSNQLDKARSSEPKWEWSVNSWRYHQILSALNQLHIMVLEVSLEGKIVYANRPAREYFGDIEYLSDEPGSSHMLTSILEGYLLQVGKDGADGEFPKFKEIFDEPNNSWYKITSDKVSFTDAESGYLHMIDNINEWKKNENSLKQTAQTDPLTGVYNRRYGLQSLEEAIFEVKAGVPYCVAFLDLDGLKIINVEHGHTAGDYALRTIADTLASSIRDNRDIVCRFGGDEFVVIFKNCRKTMAKQAVARMWEKLGDINREHQKGFDVEFSHGIIEIDTGRTPDLRSVIEEVDQIMYKNKAARKEAKRLAKELEDQADNAANM